jgi:hypothetical protein
MAEATVAEASGDTLRLKNANVFLFKKVYPFFFVKSD